MKNKQTRGAIAALICATSFIIGLVVILVIAPDFNDGPEQRLATFTQYTEWMQLWYFLVYIVFGVSILVLSLALLETEHREHTNLEQITTLASYLWACYILASGSIAILSIEFLFSERFQFSVAVEDMWQDIYRVQMGLGEGVEWVGAIWVLLINTCLLKKRRFSKPVLWFGYGIGLIGLLTLYQPLQEVGALFGLLQIVWFVLIAWGLYKETRLSQV